MVARPQVVNRPVLLALPQAPQFPSGAQFGDAGPGGSFVLEGYDVSRGEQGVALTLYWRTLTPPSAPLQRFVHAVDAGGQIAAQSDAVPENGGAPPSAWRSGEVVIDRVNLVGETEKAVQFYVGWYDPATGDRLPVRTTGDVIQPDGRLAIPLREP